MTSHEVEAARPERHRKPTHSPVVAPAQRTAMIPSGAGNHAMARAPEPGGSADWERLNSDERRKSGGAFDARDVAVQVFTAISGWFSTEEDRLFSALEGRTPSQLQAIRAAYAAAYPGRNMDADVEGDLSGTELARAKALLSGDQTATAVAALEDAMALGDEWLADFGLGATDEATIMRTLRGKSPAEIEAIRTAYAKAHPGLTLDKALASELSGEEHEQAKALLAGDHAKADAIALHGAMDWPGTDEAGISAVYDRVREEVEAESRGKTTAEVGAEVKRRTEEIRVAYSATYDPKGDGKALDRAFADDLSGGELNLALAQQSGRLTAIDVAKMQVEHQSFYANDDRINALLRSQYDRARREVMRDFEAEYRQRAADVPREQHKELRRTMEAGLEQRIEQRSKENMAALEAGYDKADPLHPLRYTLAGDLQGYSREEGLKRLDSGGKLSDPEELKYALLGAGSNESRVKETLAGKSKQELATLAEAYRDVTKSADAPDGHALVDDLAGDLWGRDYHDAIAVLEEGDSTPEERVANLQRRTQWELGWGSGVGRLLAGDEAAALEGSAAEAKRALAAYQSLRGTPGEDAALERLERWLGYADKDLDTLRDSVDAISDAAATVAGLAAGLAFTVLSGGALGPVVAGLAKLAGVTPTVAAAVLGAATGAAASMGTKLVIKGQAYDFEAAAADATQATADALIAAATAGTGEAILKALTKSPAFASLRQAAQSGGFARVAQKSVEGMIEGAVSGAPSGAVSAILNENTWKSDNALLVIFESAADGAGTGAVTGAAFGAVGEVAEQHRLGKRIAQGTAAGAHNSDVEVPFGPGPAANENVEVPFGPGPAANENVEVPFGPEPAAKVDAKLTLTPSGTASNGAPRPDDLIWGTYRSKVYHEESSHHFGQTNGYKMTRAQAELGGYRPAKTALAEAAHGQKVHKMVADAARQHLKPKGLAALDPPTHPNPPDELILATVEQKIGKRRPDAVSVNHGRKYVVIEDTFTGPVEPHSHWAKGWEPALEGKIAVLRKLGYYIHVVTGMQHPSHQH